MCRMSTGMPARSRSSVMVERETLWKTTVLTTAAPLTIGDVQHAQVHLTQNAGHPLSGPDSLVPIAQVSGTNSELMPLASAISNASTAAKTTRRI